MAEARGFEPPRRVNALADFESAPFSLLGTPPNCDVTYYNTFLLGWQYVLMRAWSFLSILLIKAMGYSYLF